MYHPSNIFNLRWNIILMNNKTNLHINKPEFGKPVVKELGNALEIIKNEFRPGVNDSIPSVQNINTDG
jgi:hypothetical protein